MALAGTYLPEQHHAVSLEQLFGGNVRFFVARSLTALPSAAAAWPSTTVSPKSSGCIRGRRLGGWVSRRASCGVWNEKPGRRVTRFSGSRPAGIRPKPLPSICARALSDAMPSAIYARMAPRSIETKRPSARRRSEKRSRPAASRRTQAVASLLPADDLDAVVVQEQHADGLTGDGWINRSRRRRANLPGRPSTHARLDRRT